MRSKIKMFKSFFGNKEHGCALDYKLEKVWFKDSILYLGMG